MMQEPVTISFVGTKQIKDTLEQWAAQDERSVSYIMRQIIKRETERRQQAQPAEQKPVTQPGH